MGNPPSSSGHDDVKALGIISRADRTIKLQSSAPPHPAFPNFCHWIHAKRRVASNILNSYRVFRHTRFVGGCQSYFRLVFESVCESSLLQWRSYNLGRTQYQLWHYSTCCLCQYFFWGTYTGTCGGGYSLIFMAGALIESNAIQPKACHHCVFKMQLAQYSERASLRAQLRASQYDMCYR
eukprot:2034779-Amphidinium_carterae.2